MAVVTGKGVGDGVGNGFGEQSQVRGCGKKVSNRGLLLLKKKMGLGFVFFSDVVRIVPPLCKCWKPVFIGKKSYQVFQRGPSTSFFL